MDQVEVVALVVLVLLVLHLKVVMEVLVFNFQQHLEIQLLLLDFLDLDQPLSLLLVVAVEFLMLLHQVLVEVVDLVDHMLVLVMDHIIPIQVLQDFLHKQIVVLEVVVVDHHQHQVDLAVLV